MQRLPLANAEVDYEEDFALGESPAALLDRLITELPWRREAIVLWGRRYEQPRLIAWHGDPGAIYRYSGVRHEPLAWTPTLREIKRRVEERLGLAFDSALANYYRDHRDGMGYHSDDEPELGARPIIASVSLGAERRFVFRSRLARQIPPWQLRLASGSLLVMRGDTQRFWRHGLPKQSRPCGPRVNLTFRRIVAAATPVDAPLVRDGQSARR